MHDILIRYLRRSWKTSKLRCSRIFEFVAEVLNVGNKCVQMTVARLTVKRVAISLINEMTAFVTEAAFDGIFGLGIYNGAGSQWFRLAYERRVVQQNTFAIWLNRDRSATDLAGELSLGSIDENRIGGYPVQITPKWTKVRIRIALPPRLSYHGSPSMRID